MENNGGTDNKETGKTDKITEDQFASMVGGGAAGGESGVVSSQAEGGLSGQGDKPSVRGPEQTGVVGGKSMSNAEHKPKTISEERETSSFVGGVGGGTERAPTREELEAKRREARAESRRGLETAREKLKDEKLGGASPQQSDTNLPPQEGAGDPQDANQNFDEEGQRKEKKGGFWGKAGGFLKRTTADWEKFEKDYPQLAGWLKMATIAKAGDVIGDWFEKRQARADEKRAQKAAEKAQRKAEKEAQKVVETQAKQSRTKTDKGPGENTPPGTESLTAAEVLKKVVVEALNEARPSETPKKSAQEETKQPAPPKTEDERRKEIENLPYTRLRFKLGHESDPEKREVFREEKLDRYLDTISEGYCDLNQEKLETMINQTLFVSYPETVEENLKDLAKNLENESQAIDGYRNNPRLSGVVYDVVRGEIDMVLIDIYLGMSDNDLRARGMDREALKKRRDELSNTRIGAANIRTPAGYLQAEPTEKELEEYASRYGIPHADDILRRRDEAKRKQLEQQAREDEARRQIAQQGGGVQQEGYVDPMELMTGSVQIKELSRMTEEQQRDYVRKWIGIVEESKVDWVSDLTIQRIVLALEASLPRMNEEVRNEVKARLAIHDTSTLMRRAEGFVVNPQGRNEVTVRDAVAIAKSRGHLIGKETLKFCLEEERHGLNIKKAWNMIEVINSGDYKDVLERGGIVRGGELSQLRQENPINYYTDSNQERKDKVKSYILRQLGGGITSERAIDLGVSEEERANRNNNAEKSFELAWNLAVATMETSRWNKTVEVGNDHLAEILHFKTWKEGRAEKGRSRGADINFRAISQLGDTWIALNLIQGGRVSSDAPLTSDLIDYNKIEADKSLDYYSSTRLLRYYLLREQFLNLEVKAGSINRDVLQQYVVYFNEAEKARSPEINQKEDVRLWWVAQVVDLALYDVELGWNVDSLNELKKSVLENLSVPGYGNVGSFITEEQWNWIRRATNFSARLHKLESERGRRVLRAKRTGP